MTTVKLVFIDYRNAIYQGGFQNKKREGKGLLLTDFNHLFVGNWHSDMLEGPCLVLHDRTTFVLANFTNGKLNGDYVYYGDEEILYTSFSANIPSSSIVEIDNKIKKAYLLENRSSAQPTDGPTVVKELACGGLSLSEVVSQLKGTPADLPTLSSFIDLNFSNDLLVAHELEHSNLFLFGRGTFTQILGFELMNQSEVASVGVYMDKELHGIGCLYEKNQKVEGAFRYGLLHGLGMKTVKDSKCVYGHFANGDIREIEQIDKQANISDLTAFKTKLHLKSPNFVNEYARPSTILKYTKPDQIVKKPKEVAKEEPKIRIEQSHRTPAASVLKNSRAAQSTATPKAQASQPAYTQPSAKKTSLSSSRNRPLSPIKEEQTVKESRQVQLARDIQQARSPILTLQKPSAGIQQPNFMTPKSPVKTTANFEQPLNPEVELSQANHILNRMNDPQSELQQNIREYQTLARMIKNVKHEQQMQQQFQLNRRFH